MPSINTNANAIGRYMYGCTFRISGFFVQECKNKKNMAMNELLYRNAYF
jgi:hypothetical protein